MHPKEFFASTKTTYETGRCFVLMPFDAGMLRVYETIKEAVQGPNLGFPVDRADDIRGPGHIMDSVLEGIAKSEIVIADLTGLNANVFYELGVAHSVKDAEKVILLTQNQESIPFDISAFRCIPYKTGVAGTRRLKAALTEAITEVADLLEFPGNGGHPIYQFRVKLEQTYKFPKQLFGEGHGVYDFEIRVEYVGANAVKFMLTVTGYSAGQPPTHYPRSPHGLPLGGTLKVPCIPWQLQIDSLVDRTAGFSLRHE